MARMVGDSPAFIGGICEICGQKFCGLKIIAKLHDSNRYQRTAATATEGLGQSTSAPSRRSTGNSEEIPIFTEVSVIGVAEPRNGGRCVVGTAGAT